MATKSKRTLSWRSRSQVGYYVGTLSITEKGEITHYNVFKPKNVPDDYFHVVKIGEDTEYTVRLADEEHGSCGCPYGLKNNKRKPCRHVAALRSLVERGRIQAARWQPVVLTPETEKS